LQKLKVRPLLNTQYQLLIPTMKYTLHTTYRQMLADTVTPVSIYLKLRDRFVNTILLESSDYHGNENSFSYICCQPIARFELNGDTLLQQLPDGRETKNTVTRHRDVVEALTRSAGSSRPTTTSSRSSTTGCSATWPTTPCSISKTSGCAAARRGKPHPRNHLPGVQVRNCHQPLQRRPVRV
jgi:hypothetical protein